MIRELTRAHFDPDLCCDHEWRGDTRVRDEFGHIVLVCTKCEATCTRDDAGRIVVYDATPYVEAPLD